MTQEEADLCFFARLNHELLRGPEAIKCIDELAEIRPNFTEDEYKLFFVIMKDIIDPFRNTIRTLLMFYQNEIEENHIDRANLIQQEQNVVYSDLQEVCNHSLDLIDKVLLPSAESQEGTAFLNKMKGDILRYLIESCPETDVTKLVNQAKESYDQAIGICENELHPCNLNRLGTIMNAAVFKYKHLSMTEEAIEMLQSALRESETTINDLSENERAEAEATLSMMKTNLVVWTEGAK